jgi:hypothetical protein
LVAATILGAILLALSGLGFRWDPLGLDERRIRAAEARATTAVIDATARRFEVVAAEEQTRRLDEAHQQAVAVARATTQTITQARSAHDAETPLDPDRVRRLDRHDRELCRLTPSVCGTAAPDLAADGDDALRARAPARGSDPGRS